MVEVFVFDTSAVFTLTDNEPGADMVRAYVAGAIAGTVQLHASFVTLAEVRYITLQEQGEQIANQRMIELTALPIEWIHSDSTLCDEAAKIKANHRLSFADAFVAATALRTGGALIHKNPEFLQIGATLKHKMLPPK